MLEEDNVCDGVGCSLKGLRPRGKPKRLASIRPRRRSLYGIEAHLSKGSGPLELKALTSGFSARLRLKIF
jgi:hypothetical protein